MNENATGGGPFTPETQLTILLVLVARKWRSLLDGVSAETLAEVTGFLAGLLERLDSGLPGDDKAHRLDRGPRAST